LQISRSWSIPVAPSPQGERCGGLLVAIALVKGVFLYAQRWILIGISREIEFDLRNELSAVRMMLGLPSGTAPTPSSSPSAQLETLRTVSS
jgi:hypothetical protein